MPSYRIHRLKEGPRAQFRFAAHVSGLTQIKPKDYELGGEVDATHSYAAWAKLRGTAKALELGDILESQTGELCILKYVGFEAARWIVPEILIDVPGSALGDSESGALPSA